MYIPAEDLKNEHLERNNNLIDLLREAKSFFENCDKSEKYQSDSMSKLIEDVETGEYSIVLVGEFSSGKSTLLNALMQKRFLPSFKSPTTANVNFLRHKERSQDAESGIVTFFDGTKKTLPDLKIQTIEQYVSTRGFEVEHKIERVEFFIDSPFLKDGVTLIDSPGLNAMIEEHKEITEQQILKSHAAIFVFTAQQAGGSESEFKSLDNLKTKSGTILYVITHIDQIKRSEGETPENIVDKFKNNYKKIYPNEGDPEFWPIAPLPALAARDLGNVEYNERTNFKHEECQDLLEKSKIEIFESRLMEFLTKGEKTKRQFLEPINRVKSLVKYVLDAVESEINILNDKVDTKEIEEQIVEFNKAKIDLEKSRDQKRSKISNDIKDALAEINEGMVAKIDKFRDRFITGIDNCESLDGLQEYINSFNNRAQLEVNKVYDALKDDTRKKISDVITFNFSQAAMALNAKLEQMSSEELKFNIPFELTLDQSSFNVGLKKMTEKENELQKEINKLEEQRKISEKEKIKIRKIEKTQANLKNELQTINSTIQTLSMMTLPEIKMIPVTKEREKDFSESGLLGTIGGFIFGSQKIKFSDVKKDSSDRNMAITKRDAELSKLKGEAAEFKKQLADCYTDRSSEEVEIDLNSIRVELDSKHEKIKQLSEENRKNIQDVHAKQIKKYKTEITHILEDKAYEFSKILRKEHNEKEQIYINIVEDVVISNITAELDNVLKKLDLLQKNLLDSEENKTLRLQTLSDYKTEAERILTNAIGLETKFENLEVHKLN
ncbi:MAG: dynamin family protein [Clostridiales Family XIII bacterium]|jgi:GTPase SAR1 family protein|nr:dynamin family protein [Clostridiales Family XIII bacterium]